MIKEVIYTILLCVSYLFFGIVALGMSLMVTLIYYVSLVILLLVVSLLFSIFLFKKDFSSIRVFIMNLIASVFSVGFFVGLVIYLTKFMSVTADNGLGITDLLPIFSIPSPLYSGIVFFVCANIVPLICLFVYRKKKETNEIPLKYSNSVNN